MASSSIAKYPYPSLLNVANFVSVKLNYHNYLIWRMQMVSLIESQDFLGFVDGSIPPPQIDGGSLAEEDYLLWKKSDRLLKGWILGSICDDILNTMVSSSSCTARDVWKKLELENNYDLESKQHFHHHDEPPVPTVISAGTAQMDISFYLPLHKAALAGDWKSARKFFDDHQEAVTAIITSYAETALHIAVGTGKAIHFVRNLVELMPKEALALQNKGGNTALNLAAMVDNTEAAMILVEKDPALVYIYNNYDSLPIHRAAVNAHRNTLTYLLKVTKDNVEPNPFAAQSGVKLLIHAIVSGFYDIASDLVKRYPHLATLETSNGNSAMTAIARKASAFRSGSNLNYWDSIIYSCVSVPKNYSNHSNGGDIENPTGNSQAAKQMSDGGLLGENYFSRVSQLLLLILQEGIEILVPRIKHIRKIKLIHLQALQLVKILCVVIKSANDHYRILHHLKPVLLAASVGIHEVVEEIVDAFPDAVWSCDENGHYIFQLAVINRCEKVFNLIYPMSEHKQYLMRIIDTSENNILHLAGRMAPPHKLNLVSGPALQMQRELQWFKEVEKSVKPAYIEKENSSKQTPAMVFSEEHKNLVKEGEKWMKDTATSCTIAAALITTVVFAAAITVPGGSDPATGHPILSSNPVFTLFVIADAISMFTATTSLLMFLSILTSRYAEEDFLRILPQRLIIGLVTLFVSTTCMMTSFSATLYLVVGEQKAYVIIPIALLACLPITSFVTSQTLLIIDVISSTYGRGIFGKQSDRDFY